MADQATLAQSKCVIYALYCVCADCPAIRFRYVGQTRRGISVRFRAYSKPDRRTLELSGHLPVYKWLRKHGYGNIRYWILERFDNPQALDAREMQWIEFFDTSASRGGLNVRPGGGTIGGYKMSPASILKMKAVKAGKSTGELNPRAKFTASDVSEIRRLLWSGMSRLEVTEMFGAKLSTVNKIAVHNTWTDVPWPIGPVPNPRPAERRSVSNRGKGVKLNAFQVQDIRTLALRDGVTLKELAQQYGVTTVCIRNVVQFKTWTHLPWPEGVPAYQKIEVRKLAESEIIYAREQLSRGVSETKIAAELGCSRGPIHKLVDP